MTIKELTWRIILPLTIVSFGNFTKWWYVLPVDAPDSMLVGFPLAFVGEGWFTSMSLQIFLFEFIFDFAIYFLFWVFIVLLTRRILKKIYLSRMFRKIIWILSILTISFWIMVSTICENHVKFKRDWEMQVLVTGFKLTWAYKSRPELSMYDPRKNKRTPEN